MRVASSRKLLAGLLAVGLFGCTSGDPKTVKFWVDKINNDHTEREKKADAAHLQEVAKTAKDPGGATLVASLLKNQPGDVVAAAASALGDMGDKSVVPELVDAVDISRGSGADHATEEANHANKAIARTLGQLGDKGATPGLLKLLKSKDNYTVIEAINALGDLKDPAGVKSLSDIATDTSIEPFVNKKAIMALGQIADPGALPAVHQMLYEERKGMSFFAESSFAIYEIGKPSTDMLIGDLKGSDPKFAGWAKDHGILRGAVLAKTAQMLGDLNDSRAESELLKLLSYKDEDAQLQYATRMQAADALGRMRSTKAVKPLTEMLGDEEVAARNTYMRALRFIGDKSAVAAVAKKMDAPKESIGYREEAYKTVALMGDAAEAKAYDSAFNGEEKRLTGECKEAEIGDADCQAQIKEVTARLKQYKAALATNCATGSVSCWTAKLQDPNPFVRTRAALELGHSGKADALSALFDAIQKPLDGADNDAVQNQDEARFAAIMAVHWLLDSGAKASDAAGMADKLEKQVEAEKSKTATMRSAEDVKRLAVRLRRA
ncbi:MAG: HEAT repeat domain-containing protein [Deltaproteobacteria bacterium]|nr:HEAT repeat domain-containing protein [Deltaproteobacteria bacterium]